MMKYFAKKIGRGSGSNSSGQSANDESKLGSTTVRNLPTFAIDEESVTRFIELLHITVLTKFSDRSDPLVFVDDESTFNLAADFILRKAKKADFETYPASTLWSAAFQIITAGDKILSQSQCEALSSFNFNGVATLASGMSSSQQKLLGTLFGACEMLIRDEPACAAMVLNQLSNTLIWGVAPNTADSSAACVNLIADHRRYFPACHTFARRFSTTVVPIEAQEWRRLGAESVAIYGTTNATTTPSNTTADAAPSPISADSPPALSPQVEMTLNSNNINNNDNNSSTAANNNNNSNINNATNNKSRNNNWRSSSPAELQLNDVNASASIDGKYIVVINSNYCVLNVTTYCSYVATFTAMLIISFKLFCFSSYLFHFLFLFSVCDVGSAVPAAAPEERERKQL